MLRQPRQQIRLSFPPGTRGRIHVKWGEAGRDDGIVGTGHFHGPFRAHNEPVLQLQPRREVDVHGEREQTTADPGAATRADALR